MIAAGEGDARIVGRVLFKVDPPRPLVQRVEVVGRLILPAGVGHKRPVRSQGVEQGAHDGLRAANHVPERGHPAMHHRRPARPQPEVLQVPSEPRACYQHDLYGNRSPEDGPLPPAPMRSS